MIHNATVQIKNTDITAKTASELRDIEAELNRAFARYSVPYSWILSTAELLQRYERLSGKKYKPNPQEDTIV